MPVDGGKSAGRIMWRGIDETDHAPSRHVLRRNIRPVLSIIAGQMDQSVVASGPEQALLPRRLGECEHGVIVFDTGDVEGNRAARGLLLGFVVASQVRADGFPGASLVTATQYHLRRGVQHVGIVRRDEQRLGPLQAVLEAGCAIARNIQGIDRHVAEIVGAVIVAGHLTAVGIRVNDLAILGVGRDEATFAAAHGEPILPADHSLVIATGNGDGGVVLLRAVHAIREAVVHRDMIELRGGLIVRCRPCLATVQREAGPAVIAVDQAARVLRVDPQRVMIAVRRGHQVERLAAVGGAERTGIEHIDDIGGDGIRKDMGEIPGALPEAVVVVDSAPGSAGVL